VILCKLEYPIVATTFMRRQCDALMRPILSARLPSMGLTRTFPRAMVHGPWQWQGLNIPHLYMEHTAIHIHMVLKFGENLKDITGSLLEASCNHPRIRVIRVYFLTPTWLIIIIITH